MDRRTPRQIIAANVASVITDAGVSIASVAQATDMPTPTFEARLRSESAFTALELARVGGFFRTGMSTFLKGAAA